MRLIDADALKKCAIPCEIHNGALTDLCVPLYQIDNAPTVESRIEYGTDGQAYILFISGGQVVPDMLQGWKYEERPKGEWIFIDNDIGWDKCSNCNWTDTRCHSWNFCPNCGADMRGGRG